MFRDVPECSGMFHVPGFIDARFELYSRWVLLVSGSNAPPSPGLSAATSFAASHAINDYLCFSECVLACDSN